MFHARNREEPSKLQVGAARLVDVCFVSSIVVLFADIMDIKIHFLIDDIPDSRIGESILDQLKFLALCFTIWPIYWLTGAYFRAKTIGIACAGIAIYDSTEDTRKASFLQLRNRITPTLKRLMLAILVALMVLGVEAIFLLAISTILWAYISDLKNISDPNLKGVWIDQKSGTRIVREKSKISFDNRVIIWSFSISMLLIIVGILLVSLIWLWGQPFEERQYRNRILVLEDRLEQICHSPSLSEYCR